MRTRAPKWLVEKRRRLALEVACPQCGQPIKQRCKVAGGFHDARADYAYQRRKAKVRL
jgi:hypothetical protein